MGKKKINQAPSNPQKTIKKLKKIKKKTKKNKKRQKKNFSEDFYNNYEDYLDDYDMRIMYEDDLENMPHDKYDSYPLPKTKKEHEANTKDTIENSEIILEIIDARNPSGTRIPKEKEDIILNSNKYLVIVLNKIDLVSDDFVKKATENLKKNANGKLFVIPTTACNRESIQNFYQEVRKLSQEYLNNNEVSCVRIGIIGYPNMGKESILNSLKLSEEANIYEKKMIYFTEEKEFGINSIIGTVYEDNDDGSILVSKTEKDVKLLPESKVNLIKNMFDYVDPTYIKTKYNINFNGSFDDFCAKLLSKFTHLKDKDDIYNLILKDILNGKIKYEIA